MAHEAQPTDNVDGLKVHNIVAVFIIGRDGVLFLRRAGTEDIEPGKWGVVNGHIDGNETSIQAALREIEEEAGIKADAKDLIYLGTHRAELDYKRKGKLVPFIGDIYCLVDYGLTKDHIRLDPREHSEFDFVGIETFLRFRSELAAPRLRGHSGQSGGNGFRLSDIMEWPDKPVIMSNIIDPLMERLRSEYRRANRQKVP